MNIFILRFIQTTPGNFKNFNWYFVSFGYTFGSSAFFVHPIPVNDVSLKYEKEAILAVYCNCSDNITLPGYSDSFQQHS